MTESYGEGVVSGVSETEKDSNLDRRFKPFHIITARITHIMWLVNLTPEIQEAILFLARVESGRDTVKEIEMRRIARVMAWGVQGGGEINEPQTYVRV